MPSPLAPPAASPGVAWGMALLALAVSAWLPWAVGRAGEPSRRRRRTWVAAKLVALLLALTWVLADQGVLARFDRLPPPFVVAVLLIVVSTVALGLSPLGGRMAAALPFSALVGLQVFRLPLELVMHRAAVLGVMPNQMTYTGRNFDIVSGALALLVWIALAAGWAPRWALWLWNLLGAALLVNIVAVAIASLPTFHAFGTAPEQLNTWVAFPPFVWLPTVLVPAALLGHILVTRRLLAPGNQQ